MNAPDTVVSRQGDTLSGIAYKRYGSSVGQVERILELNPGLCNQPVLLPAGVIIRMPAPATTKTKKVSTLNLWD